MADTLVRCKPGGAGLGRVALCVVFMCSLMDVPSFALSNNQMRVSNEFSVTVNSVSGDGKASSSLSDGAHYLDVLSINGSALTASGYDFTYNAGIKATDDRRNDLKNFSFTNFQARLSNNARSFTFGDTLEYYSQYSLNSALKGFSYRENGQGLNPVQWGAVYGIAYPRWDSFYGGTEVKAILRHAVGATVRKTVMPGLAAGFSVAQVIDNDSSRITPGDSIFKGGVYAFDAEYEPMLGLSLHSELAFSGVKEELGGGGYADHNGAAFKLDATGSGGPSRVTAEYERVDAQFLSPLGAAVSDREKLKTKWKYIFTKNITTNLGLLWYRNNLNGSQAFGTSSTRPEIGVNIRNMFFRSSAVADVTYSMFLQNGGGNKTTDRSLNIGYRDRFAWLDNDTNIGFNAYDTETNIRKNSETIFNTTLGTQYDAGALTYRPGLTLGVWNVTDDILNQTSRITEYSLGTAIEAPAMNIVSHVRLGQNKLDTEAQDSDKFFASGDVYYRPPSMARMNATLFLKALYNNYDYTTAAQNFRETSVTSGLNIQF